jgi:hypothetical protein
MINETNARYYGFTGKDLGFITSHDIEHRMDSELEWEE